MTDEERGRILSAAAQTVRDKIGATSLRRPPGTLSVSYVQPPLVLPPRDDNLHLVRRPPVSLAGEEVIVAFESATDLIFSSPQLLNAELSSIVSTSASKLIRRFSAPEEQLTALLWTLAGAQGVDLELSEHTCLLHTAGWSGGIENHQLVSRFTKRDLPAFSPLAVLTGNGPVCKGTDGTFITAYGISNRVDRSGDLALVVATLYQAVTPLEFRTLVLPAKRLTRSQSMALEEAVFTERDPVMVAYRRLVPVWMTHTEFQRKIANIEGRTIKPSARRRTTLFNKLSSQPFFRQ